MSQECITHMLIRIIDGIDSAQRHLHVVTCLSLHVRYDVNMPTVYTQTYRVTSNMCKYTVACENNATDLPLYCCNLLVHTGDDFIYIYKICVYSLSLV